MEETFENSSEYSCSKTLDADDINIFTKLQSIEDSSIYNNVDKGTLETLETVRQQTDILSSPCNIDKHQDPQDSQKIFNNVTNYVIQSDELDYRISSKEDCPPDEDVIDKNEYVKCENFGKVLNDVLNSLNFNDNPALYNELLKTELVNSEELLNGVVDINFVDTNGKFMTSEAVEVNNNSYETCLETLLPESKDIVHLENSNENCDFESQVNRTEEINPKESFQTVNECVLQNTTHEVLGINSKAFTTIRNFSCPGTSNSSQYPSISKKENEHIDSEDDSDGEGFNFNDFEFISEEEAKKEGLILYSKRKNYHTETLQNKRVRSQKRNYTNKDDQYDLGPETSSTSSNPGSWNPIYSHNNRPANTNYRDNHRIPREEYIELFRMQNAPLPHTMNIIQWENKAIIPRVAMIPPLLDIGFDIGELMRRHMENDDDQELIDEAEESRKKIFEMYPENNSWRR